MENFDIVSMLPVLLVALILFIVTARYPETNLVNVDAREIAIKGTSLFWREDAAGKSCSHGR